MGTVEGFQALRLLENKAGEECENRATRRREPTQLPTSRGEYKSGEGEEAILSAYIIKLKMMSKPTLTYELSPKNIIKEGWLFKQSRYLKEWRK